jgi:DNA mismatch repair ATPase MutS
MNVFLLYRDRDPDLEGEALPHNAEALTQDLGLTNLFDAMAAGDPFLFEVARKTMLASLLDPEAIRYRQDVLADCLANPAVVRRLYAIAVEGVQAQRKIWLFSLKSSSPDSILRQSQQLLRLLVEVLAALRAVADEHASAFRSEGFVRLFDMLARELDDDYLRTVRYELDELEFRRGVLMSAELGRGNKGTRYVLRRTPELRWTDRFARRNRRSLSFEIADRDESGSQALTDLRARGINLVANALGQSADHVRSFFAMLRAQLAFYVGCLNLHERLTGKGEPVAFPTAEAPPSLALSAGGLYDPGLSLRLETRVVGNDLAADGKTLVMVTGANQGGKSTFLRSLGIAYLMMQSGMFVAAQSLRAGICTGLFTHFKREEDEAMESGKLDEELRRMSALADAIRPRSVLLCNESFASTNEREASEIARQVIRAFREAGVRIVFVTHLFDLARSVHRDSDGAALFLRAERREGGRRTFRILPGDPMPTSHGEDSYRRVFGAHAHPMPEAAPT